MISAALLAEMDLLSLCNNRIIHITASQSQQKQRLTQRGHNHNRITQLLTAQWSADKKQQVINQAISQHGFGKLWQYDSESNLDVPTFMQKILCDLDLDYDCVI